MTRRRMEVSAEEEQILLGLRHERDIWNKALEAAMVAINSIEYLGARERQIAQEKLMELRK